MHTSIPLPNNAQMLLDRLEELWKFIDSTMEGYSSHPANLRQTILLLMTAASHRIIRGILAGFRGGSIDTLDIAVRSLVEGLINTKYVLEDDTDMRARAYIVEDNRDRLRTVRRLISMLERGAAPGMATVTEADRYRTLQGTIEQELHDFETTYGRDNLRWGSLEQRAVASHSEELYATAFWLLSLDSHLTVRGLDRFMSQHDNSVVIEIGQDLSRVFGHLHSVYISYMALLNECSRYFRVPPASELARFEEEAF